MIAAAPPDSLGSQERVRGAKEIVDEGSTVGKSDFEAVSKKEIPSWVDVAQDKKVLKKFDVEVSNKDGLHSVMIPEDALKTSTPLWEDFVVGKFLDISPHVAKVHMVLNKIWKYGDASMKVEVYEVNATTMRFRVSSPRAREKILRRGMWNIAGVPMVVTKWTPRTEEEKQEEEALPMWVHLQGVPLHMYSWEGLSFITSAVGFPDRLHPETVACSNLEIAKVFAKVDISKPLPKEINFTRNGKEFVVGFHFPWLPSRCKLCDKWGHTTEVCVLKGKEVNLPPKGISTEDEVSLKSLHTHSDVEVQVEHLEITKGEEVLDVVETQQEIENVDVGENEVGGETNWALVSPTKVGRSPGRTSCQSEDIHISVSKFAVLSVEEEQEEGEISEKGQALTVVSIPDSERGIVENVEGLAQQSQVDQECEVKETGAKRKQSNVKGIKEKKAKSQDTNPLAMSTRSSSRHL